MKLQSNLQEEDRTGTKQKCSYLTGALYLEDKITSLSKIKKCQHRCPYFRGVLTSRLESL